MDMMILVVSLIAFVALIVSWLVLPASTEVDSVAHPIAEEA